MREIFLDNVGGKSQHEVRKLIAGPQAAICDECIEACVRMIEEEARTRGRTCPEDSADAAARWFEGRRALVFRRSDTD